MPSGQVGNELEQMLFTVELLRSWMVYLKFVLLWQWRKKTVVNSVISGILFLNVWYWFFWVQLGDAACFIPFTTARWNTSWSKFKNSHQNISSFSIDMMNQSGTCCGILLPRATILGPIWGVLQRRHPSSAGDSYGCTQMTQWPVCVECTMCEIDQVLCGLWWGCTGSLVGTASEEWMPHVRCRIHENVLHTWK
jgi:hypothetical protein